MNKYIVVIVCSQMKRLHQNRPCAPLCKGRCHGCAVTEGLSADSKCKSNCRRTIPQNLLRKFSSLYTRELKTVRFICLFSE